MPSAQTRAKTWDEDFPTEHETGAACGLVECNRHDCREVCAIAGHWYTEMRAIAGEESLRFAGRR